MPSRRPIQLKIASPCTADWDRMTGDDAVRFCGQCKKNVYQLSEMTAEQIEALLSGPGERPCVRFYQRRDGTVLTGDCSIGKRRVRRKQFAAGLGLGALSALGLAFSAADYPEHHLMGAIEDPMVGKPPPADIHPVAPVAPEPVVPLMGEPEDPQLSSSPKE